MVAPPAPLNAINIVIQGDLDGFVAGDPPLDAVGTATADVSVPPSWDFFTTTWTISDPPDFGAASISFFGGEWIYTVDPLFYSTLDPGEIVFDSFEITATALAFNPGGQLRSETNTAIVNIEIEAVCFRAGTLIDTPTGERLVEELCSGDLVSTRDNGALPVQWVEWADLQESDLVADPKLRPVRIGMGSLDAGLPERDIYVSQEHRVLVSTPVVSLLFGVDEVLCAAKFLVGWPGIDVVERIEPVRYVHVLLATHELLSVEGAWAESLFLGNEAYSRLGSEALEELAAIFPDRPEIGPRGMGSAARRILRRHEAQVLADYTF